MTLELGLWIALGVWIVVCVCVTCIADWDSPYFGIRAAGLVCVLLGLIVGASVVSANAWEGKCRHMGGTVLGGSCVWVHSGTENGEGL